MAIGIDGDRQQAIVTILGSRSDNFCQFSGFEGQFDRPENPEKDFLPADEGK